ncbi:MAG: dicarboxylate/amino acid:cation symporter [Simkaniaceae bacterium]
MKKFLFSNIWIFTAFILGIIASKIPIPYISTLAHGIMEIFVNLLKLISLPIIFFAIISTVTSMKSLKEAGFLLKKTLKYTLITTLIAATIGLLLFLFIDPAAQAVSSGATNSPGTVLEGSYFSFLLKIIPSNPVQAFLDHNVLGVAFIAGILSIAILQLPAKYQETVAPFFQGMFQALLKIASWVIRIIPIGIFGFTYYFMENLHSTQVHWENILLYALCVIGANLIQGLIILPLLLKIKGISPWRLAKAMSPALITAFFSKSSSATLPLALENAEKRAKIPGKISSFSLPLCSIINMNGCAAFILITVLFVSISNGISFAPVEWFAWIFISTLAAIGNAGVPMGCYFLTGALLMSLNVNLDMLGIILPLYALFDMVETALNVWSDSCVTASVAKEIEATESLAVKT